MAVRRRSSSGAVAVAVAAAVVVVVVCAVLVPSSLAASYDKELHCSACRATAAEIVAAVERTADAARKEKIEKGSRLTRTNRYETIEFEQSEARFMSLLESLCTTATFDRYGRIAPPGEPQYYARRPDDDARHWQHWHASGAGKDLKATCEYLVGEFEEELVAALRARDFSERSMCADVARVCSPRMLALEQTPTLAPPPTPKKTDDDDDDDDDDDADDAVDDDSEYNTDADASRESSAEQAERMAREMMAGAAATNEMMANQEL